MASFMNTLNRLLPFATPGTPLIQDLVHLAAICVLLYFAPQVQEWLQRKRKHTVQAPPQALDGGLPDESFADEPREVIDDQHQLPLDDAAPVEDNAAAIHNEEIPAVAQAHDEVPLAEGEAGPARIPAQRDVGAKKAKSLARKDQRRAYNEFLRSQGDAERARNAEGAAEREAALEAERQRRRKVEEKLEAEKARERKERREREEAERAEEIHRRDLVVSLVKEELGSKKMCDLFAVAKQVGDDVDEEWIETILRASGVLQRTGDSMTMITGTGWIVRVTSSDMMSVYKAAMDADLCDENGRIDSDVLGTLLEKSLRERGSV